MTVTSKANLAAELEISKARVSQYVSEGLPVRSDGKLNRDEALDWIACRHVYTNTDEKGAGRARKLSAARRSASTKSQSRASGLSGGALPAYMAAVGSCDDAFDRGALSMALHVAYTSGAVIAVGAVMEGVALKLAYALRNSATVFLMDSISEFCHGLKVGPFADAKDPDIYDLRAFHDCNWAALAEKVGEPLDVEGWEKALRDRHAAGLR